MPHSPVAARPRPPAVRAAARRPAAAPLVIGPLPPPVTGAAAMTAALAAALDGPGGAARRVSLSPGRARGAARHPVRAARALGAGAALAAARARGARALCLACDGGAGRLYALGLLAAARALGMRVRLHHHSFAYIDRPDGLMRALLRAGGPGLGHVFLSEGMRDRFRAAYGPGRGDLVLSNAVFLETPAPPPRPPAPGPGGPAVGLLANLTAAKGLHEMIALARHLHARGRPGRVRLAGPVADPADRRALGEAMAALGRDRLDWVGPVSGEAKAAFYASLDLFALPTRHADEAQPAVIWEAAFAGLPTLAWARGAIPEQVGERWLLRDPRDPFAPWAAARLAALTEAPGRLRALGAAARARAEAEAETGRAALARLAGELAGAGR
jgi:glycosyltransferase involved in cell wall biosynthesis